MGLFPRPSKFFISWSQKRFTQKSALNRHLKAHENELPSVGLLAQPVGKLSTTAPLTTLIFDNNLSLQLENALLKKLQMLRPQKYLRGRTKQVRVPIQNQLPQQVLKTPLLADNLILFSFQPTLFQLAKKTSPKHTGNIGRRSVRVLAARIVYKSGKISACLRSVLPPSANNWIASLLTRPRFSKSTFPLVLFSVTQKLAPSSTTTLLQTTIWC